MSEYQQMILKYYWVLPVFCSICFWLIARQFAALERRVDKNDRSIDIMTGKRGTPLSEVLKGIKR